MKCPECGFSFHRDIFNYTEGTTKDICPNCGTDVIIVSLKELDDITVKKQPEELVEEEIDDLDEPDEVQDDEEYNEDEDHNEDDTSPVDH